MDIQHLYARLARSYDFGLWLFGFKRAVHYFVDNLPFDKEKSLNVLDAGCGTGLYSLEILKQYPHAQVTACDMTEAMISQLRQSIEQKQLKTRTRVFNADITSHLQELEDEKFDLIITSGVMEYVPIDDTVRNLSRFLRQGGHFLNSPVKDNAIGTFLGRIYGFRPYSRERNVGAFQRNNFVLEEIITRPWYVPTSFKEVHLFRKE